MTLEELRTAAAGCTACDLYRHATQTVFGEGSSGARLMLVGEQPTAEEIAACRPWLEQEVEAVGPEVLACLGATAAQALLGRTFRVTKERGTMRELKLGSRTLTATATVHPSSILRAPDEDARAREYDAFVADLMTVAHMLLR